MAPKKSKAKGKKLPTPDPAAFQPGDTIQVGKETYTVQQNQLGDHRVMVTNPEFTPEGGEPRFLFIDFKDVTAHSRP